MTSRSVDNYLVGIKEKCVTRTMVDPGSVQKQTVSRPCRAVPEHVRWQFTKLAHMQEAMVTCNIGNCSVFRICTPEYLSDIDAQTVHRRVHSVDVAPTLYRAMPSGLLWEVMDPPGLEPDDV